MRILYIGESPYMPILTGMGRVAKELVTRLMHSGHDIIAAYWSHPAKPAPYPVHPLPDKNRGIVDQSLNTLFEIVMTYKPDCIIGQGDIFYFNGLHNLMQKVYLPFVGYLNLDSYEPNPSFLTQLSAMKRVCMSSRWAASYLSDYFGLKNVTFKHHGVDTLTFKPLNIKKKQQIIYVGQATVRKNVIGLVRAFAKAKDRGLKSKLYLKLQLMTDSDVVIECIKNGILNDVVIDFSPKHDPEINILLNESLFFVTATNGEGFGLPVLEAMAAGIPVIAPDHTSLSELVSRDRGKLISTVAEFPVAFDMKFKAVDVDKMADAMVEMEKELSDPTIQEKYKSNCVKFASEKSWDELASYIEKLCFEAVEEFYQLRKPFVPRIVVPHLFFKSKSDKLTTAVVKHGNVGDYLQLIPVIKAITKVSGKKPAIYGRNGVGILRFFGECVDTDIGPNEIIDSIKDNYNTIYFYITYNALILKHGVVEKNFDVLPSVASNFILQKDYVTSLIESSGFSRIVSIEDLSFPPDIDLPEFDAKDFVLVGLDGYLPPSKLLPFNLIDKIVAEIKKLGLKTAVPNSLSQIDADYVIPPDPEKELAAVRASRLVLTLDNRFMWMAYAFRKDVITLFGPTNPALALIPNNVVLTENQCPPCWFTYSPCLYQLPICKNYPSMEKILDKIKEVLDGRSKATA